MQKIVIYGDVASKKNNRRNFGHISLPSERYIKWHDKAVPQVLKQKKKSYESCKIVITFYHGTKRRKDADNGVCSVFDTLVDCGVLVDDGWVNIPFHCAFNAYEKNCGRTEIDIYELDEQIDFSIYDGF
jgi:Holliday junction resolvase RusA-like endonuclease